MAVEIKGRMVDFLCGAGIEILELRLAGQEIIQVEKVWDTEQSRQSQKQMQRRMKCLVHLEVGEVKCGWSIWHVEGNGRRCSWRNIWGQSVKVHQCSVKELGIYPASNGDPAEVFSRAV